MRREVERLLASHARAGGFLAEAAAPPELPPAVSMEGRSIGAYRVLRQIGRGGMGAVYLAARAGDEYQQEVAVKVLHGPVISDFAVQRFRAERQILAAVHSNIADVLEGRGENEPALGSVESARAVFAELAALDPEDAQARIDLALALLKVAKLRLKTGGDLEVAASESKRAVDLLEPLVAEHPDNSYAQAVLVHALGNHGDLLAAGGRFDAAVASYRRGVALQEALVRDVPGSVSRRFNLAAAHAGLAAVLTSRGRAASTGGAADWRAASGEYTRGLALFDELGEQGALSGTDHEGIAEIRRQAREVEALLSDR